MLSCFFSVSSIHPFHIPDFSPLNLVLPFSVHLLLPLHPRSSRSQGFISCFSSLLCTGFLFFLLCDTSSKTRTKHLLNRMRVDNVRRPCVSVCFRVCPCITSFYVGGCGTTAGFGSRTMFYLNGLSIVPQTSCLPC